MVITAVNNLPAITNKSQGLINSYFSSQELISPKSGIEKISTSIPSYTGDFVVIPLPSQSIGIIEVIVNGQVLSPVIDNRFDSFNLPATENSLPSQSYWYDYENQDLYIAPTFNASGLTVVYSIPQTSTIKSTEITDFPDFFSLFNITGTFSITRSFQSHPQATLTIIDDYQAKYSQIKSYFQKGTNFTIRGIGFRADNPQIKINQLTGKMECVVNFKGKWEGYNGNIDSDLDKPVSVSDLIKASGRDYYTVSQAVSKAGVPFSGSSRKIYVSIPVATGSSVTARSLLENNTFYPNGQIIDWETPARVQLRSWGEMPSLTLPDYLPEYDISTGDKTKLTNAVLTLEKADKGQGDKYQTITEGRSDYQSPPRTPKNGYYEAFNIELLRTPSWCFDTASEKTIFKIIKQLNGFDIEVTEEEWGFVYASNQVYLLTDNSYYFNLGISLDDLWQKVRITTKTYNYSDDGYLENVRGTTTKLIRLKQETAELEAAKLALAISQETDVDAIAQLTKQLDAYRNFFWITEPYNEDYSNSEIGKFYPELDKEDNSKIPNQYVQELTTGQGAIFAYPNPDSTDDNPLPEIIIGEQRRENLTTNITDTRLKKFKERQEVSTVKGFGLEDTVSSTNEVDKNGIPSTATRLQKFGFTDDGDSNDGENVTKYLISTDGSSLASNIENGSVSYSNLKTLSEGLLAVRTDYSIRNSQTEESVTITTKTPLDVTMGQTISKGGVSYRLFNYTESFNVSGVVNCESVVLTLGKYQSVSVSSRSIS